MRAAVTVLAALALTPTPAAADDNDLVLSRLARLVTDGDGAVVDAVGDRVAFRSLASELGVVLAPRLGEPADTLGYGGFAVTTDLAFTGIASAARFWRVLESSPAPAASGVAHGRDLMATVSVFARKGLWFPLPSFEVGVGAVHLLRSRIWAAQAYGKLALHEGYRELPLPSVAVRAGVSRMMGQSDLDLTVGSLDLVLSKNLGVAGVFRLAPYLGGDLLAIVARSEVIDATPAVDALAMPADRAADFVFARQDPIYRTRVFGGLKATCAALTFAIEIAIARHGDSRDDRAGTASPCRDDGAPITACDAGDDARRQTTVSASLGADF